MKNRNKHAGQTPQRGLKDKGRPELLGTLVLVYVAPNSLVIKLYLIGHLLTLYK